MDTLLDISNKKSEILLALDGSVVFFRNISTYISVSNLSVHAFKFSVIFRIHAVSVDGLSGGYSAGDFSVSHVCHFHVILPYSFHLSTESIVFCMLSNSCCQCILHGCRNRFFSSINLKNKKKEKNKISELNIV